MGVSTRLSQKIQTGNGRVLDINGRTVYQQKGSAEQSFKFGAALISGMYLVEVRQGDEMQTVKAVKIK